jgi:hypothetical protein
MARGFVYLAVEVEPWPVYDRADSGSPLTDTALHEWLGLFAYWALSLIYEPLGIPPIQSHRNML